MAIRAEVPPQSLWRVMRGAACAATLLAASQAVAQNQTQEQPPLSVIDWLGTQNPSAALPAVQPSAPVQALPQPEEPPVAKTALAPAIAVQPLSESGPREIGLVPAAITGLPADLWVGSDIDRLTRLIAKMPDLHLPAAQSLLYTVLLAESRAPGNNSRAGDRLALARVGHLVQRGALDPALSLMEQAGVATSPAHFDLWMRASLLAGTEDRACARLAQAPHLTQDYATRIFCQARAGLWEDAALTLGSARALGLMPDAQLDLMDRFLDPEGFEGEPLLPVPAKMDPLTFRLFETIGEPVPTRNLPRAYAVADLRDLAGWKAQLEAAERLTRAGALPDNRLLGLYSERKAAASGGVWDRVRALKQFETALAAGSLDAVAKTLPPVWQEMQRAELEVSFATLFDESLAPLALTGAAGDIALDVALLSPRYEVAAARVATPRLAEAIAQGTTGPQRPTGVMNGAVYDAFNDAKPRADLVAMAQQGRLGESILEVLHLLHKGARGTDRALTEALASLRALGLEDTARRAALQVLLLER